jgi:hypothetical protein
VLAITLTIAWMGLGVAPAAAGQVETRIVNGVFESEQPSTGALLLGSNPDSAYAICSGTMIGCETFLTAAHCVCESNGSICTGGGAPNPSDFSVFLQHAGFFNVSSISLRSDYSFPVADVAVLKLSAATSGIPPSPINTTETPAFGTPGIIVGFGRSGGFNDDYGLKRSGAVTTTACTGGTSNTTSVCWTFEHPIGPPGEDSNTCSGDSGGPLFVDFGAGPVVAGVTSGGISPDCLPTDESFDANVHFYREWIQLEGGADLQNEACGDLPQVGEPEALVFSEVGEVSTATPEATHSFAIPEDTLELRVTMNAEDDGYNDFNLYVKAGSPPTTSDFDCERNGPGQLAVCEFSSPAGGDWHVLVAHSWGAGAYQVTATAFTTSCSDPANHGQPCDDRNPCTIDDTCQFPTCVGTLLPNGSDCEDGSFCTQGDSCQGGVCTPGAGPIAGCYSPTVPGRSRLLLADKTRDRNDRLVWRWDKGESTPASEFGDPTATTEHALCVYDEVGGTPTLVSETLIPAGGNWIPLRQGGYRYNDRSRASDGIRLLLLRPGTDGRARIVVRGKGENVQLPAMPLQQQSHVIVQLVNENACWEADYSTYVRRDVDRFDARSD